MAHEPQRQPMRGTTHEPARLYRRTNRDDWAFDIDPRKIPPDTSYEFKRTHTLNEPDHVHISNLALDHWRPVPTSRHPEKMPAGTDPNAPIVVEGMTLMERPKYLTEEAHAENYAAAMEPVQTMKARLGEKVVPAGTIQVGKLNRSVERGVVPD
jgi:hypothetical protein